MLICYLVFTITIIFTSVKLIFNGLIIPLNRKELSIAAVAAFQQSREEVAVGNSAFQRPPYSYPLFWLQAICCTITSIALK
jgi:hypothetical protein